MSYTWEMEQRIAATIGQLNKERWFQELCEEQRKADKSCVPELRTTAPRRISITDTEALNQNLADVASGAIEVVGPERKVDEHQENEISAHDQKALNANIQAIATSAIKVRF